MKERINRKPYRIIYGKDFLKDFNNLVKNGKKWLQKKAQEKIDQIKYDPYTKRPKVDIKLISKREEGVYRVRVGNYRMVYEVDEKEKKIEFTLIFPRGKGYKKK